MAYIEKVTHIRRFAVIRKGNGNIVREGVEIEGRYLVWDWVRNKHYAYNKKDFKRMLKRIGDCKCIWQDPETEDSWEPRTQMRGSIWFKES